MNTSLKENAALCQEDGGNELDKSTIYSVDEKSRLIELFNQRGNCWDICDRHMVFLPTDLRPGLDPYSYRSWDKPFAPEIEMAANKYRDDWYHFIGSKGVLPCDACDDWTLRDEFEQKYIFTGDYEHRDFLDDDDKFYYALSFPLEDPWAVPPEENGKIWRTKNHGDLQPFNVLKYFNNDNEDIAFHQMLNSFPFIFCDCYSEEPRDLPKFFSLYPDESKKRKKFSWRDVTIDDVRKSLEGTGLGDIAEQLRHVAKPPLSLTITMPKAIVLLACALSEQDTYLRPQAYEKGIDLARLRINTAGGQPLNAFSLLVAGSGGAKDIGGITDSIAGRNNLFIGSGGSAEGVQDALIRIPSGLLEISEFAPYLDKKNWQSLLAIFLTDIFNKGWFKCRLSEKSNGKVRESPYCYPSVIAYIQPTTLQTKAALCDISSGFLGRFMIFYLPDDEFRIITPCKIDRRGIIDHIQQYIDICRLKQGVVEVPEDYLQDLRELFEKGSIHPNLRPTARRLINEYGPRLAVYLSINLQDRSNKVEITPDTWNRVRVLIKWLFANAERALSAISDDGDNIRRRERIIRRVFELIRNAGKEGVGQRLISHNTGLSSSAKERQEALTELIDRGHIQKSGERYFVLKTPPEYQ